MAGWSKKAVLVGVIAIATWGGAIIYWRSSGVTPSGLQLLAWLVLLPAGLIGAGLMLRGAVRQRKRVSSDTSGSHSGAVDAVADATASAVALLAAGLHVGDEMNASALLNSAGRSRGPTLSARFRDMHGLPVRVSAASDLDEERVLLSQQDGLDTAAHERRALALLEPVLEELLDAAVGVLPVLENGEEVVIAGLRRRTDQVIDRVLVVELLVPPQWSEALHGWVKTWLHRQVTQTGLDERRFEVRLTALADARGVWPHLQQLIAALTAGKPRWHVLLACCSHIDQVVINAWQASGVLATAAQPSGRVPGEGAAGLLLSTTQLAGDAATRLVRPHLLHPDQIEVQRPAERRRKLSALAKQWQQSLTLDEEKIQFVLHDADRDVDAVVDAAAVTAALNPDLEFSPQSFSLALHAGDIGLVMPLAQLALALAQREQYPNDAVLLLGVADEQQRMFALVDPLSPSLRVAGVPPAN
ncbi:MAG: hypothetical protein ACREP4_15900 [Stenotrophomonas sp.]|uniref:hypothetical protein n=1 Tax=Stenotrophomonas sp. TaxID=69392 RepID=UPI003D6CCB35